MKQVVLTGIKPTGAPHIGNYFGVIKRAIEMSQNTEYDRFYFIADYHALNSLKNADDMKKYYKELACTWLACGLDPEKVLFYRQSQIPETFELCWILMNVTPKGLMDRAHAYKAVVQENETAGKDPDDGVNMGLYNYPILMAADILLFNTKFVPVGKDQKQHVEMARDIAKYFNKKYGYTLVVPNEMIEEKTATIVGLDGRKMSKSYGNQLPLFADEVALKKLISGIKTDSSLPTEPKSTDCTLFEYIKLFGTEEKQAEMAKRFAEGISWADAKKELFEIANAYLKPMRDRYNRYMENFEDVELLLQKGEKQAREIARETIARVRKAIGVDEFK
ncbi:MAG: tryptophan--tRNA ligase [Clostridia bacterium]|nr:tryptophan--tRNA ligase [Clostridia bacterium]